MVPVDERMAGVNGRIAINNRCRDFELMFARLADPIGKVTRRLIYLDRVVDTVLGNYARSDESRVKHGGTFLFGCLCRYAPRWIIPPKSSPTIEMPAGQRSGASEGHSDA